MKGIIILYILLVAGTALASIITYSKDLNSTNDDRLALPLRSMDQNLRNYPPLHDSDDGESGNLTEAKCIGGVLGYQQQQGYKYNLHTIYSEILKAPELGCNERSWAMCEADALAHYAHNLKDGAVIMGSKLPHQANNLGDKLCVDLGPTGEVTGDDGFYVAFGHRLGCSSASRISYEKVTKVCCDDKSMFVQCKVASSTSTMKPISTTTTFTTKPITVFTTQPGTRSAVQSMSTTSNKELANSKMTDSSTAATAKVLH